MRGRDPELLSRLLRAEGLPTAAATVLREAEAQERGEQLTDNATADKLAAIESKLNAMQSEPPRSPEQERLRVAEAMRDHLNASLTPWHDAGAVVPPGDGDAA
jgi:hypothetical protein